jgi:tetratricopeptide (TPR) repeat protein
MTSNSARFLSNKLQIWLIIIVCAIFYVNTLSNQFAVDDAMVLTQNNSVKQGINGFGDIITKDGFYGYIGQVNDLSGGRWRPLSLLVFATEYQIFEDNATVYHLTNLLLYIFCCLVFFRLLTTYILKGNTVAAFIATLIFAIHPIHTEAVANIKSLDELLSLLFLLSTLYFSLQYIDDDTQKKNLVKALVCYALALLSKENGITFLFIIPLTIYFFTDKKGKQLFLYYIPFLIVGIVYLIIRFSFFGTSGHSTEILNSPFMLADFQQRLATKTFILGKYLLLLFLPYPLSYDYSYGQIPYVNFSSVYVVITIIIYISLFVYALLTIKKKNVVAYGILFYLISISIVSNYLIDIGATMGERFLFQPSIGFAICIGALLSMIVMIKKYSFWLFGFIGLLTIVSGYIVITRNANWENDTTLYIHDVQSAPNSLRTNLNAGTKYIDKAATEETDTVQQRADLKAALPYLEKAIVLYPPLIDPYLNMGVAYQRLGMLDTAENYWAKARLLQPDHYKVKQIDSFLSLTYLNKGMDAAKAHNDYNKGIFYLQKSLKYLNTADGWCNLGAIYFVIGNYNEAKIDFGKALNIDSNLAIAKRGYADASSRIKN